MATPKPKYIVRAGSGGDARTTLSWAEPLCFGQPFVGRRRPVAAVVLVSRLKPPLPPLRWPSLLAQTFLRDGSTANDLAGQLKRPWALQRKTFEIPREDDSMTQLSNGQHVFCSFIETVFSAPTSRLPAYLFCLRRVSQNPSFHIPSLSPIIIQSSRPLGKKFK